MNRVNTAINYNVTPVDELAADPVPCGQVADLLRTGQRLNGQVLAVAPGQPCCCAKTSVHTRTTVESMKVSSSASAASTCLHM